MPGTDLTGQEPASGPGAASTGTASRSNRPSPPLSVSATRGSGAEAPPVVGEERKGRAPASVVFHLLAERSIYLLVFLLGALAVWIWYKGATHTLDAGTLSLFSGEGNFLLAATAILVIVFEIRRERSRIQKGVLNGADPD